MTYTGRGRNFAVTTCSACYFANVTLELPERCLRRAATCEKQFYSTALTVQRCMRKFGTCIMNQVMVGRIFRNCMFDYSVSFLCI